MIRSALGGRSHKVGKKHSTRKLMLECGITTLNIGGTGNSSPIVVMQELGGMAGIGAVRAALEGTEGPLVDNIRRLKDYARKRYDIPLEIMVYSGMSSPFSGGRSSRLTSGEVGYEIISLNSAGIPFNLALNGGLTFEENIRAEDIAVECEILALLDESGADYGVENAVTVVHEAFLRLVRDEFPGLKVVASSIQQLEPRSRDTYVDKFRKHDFVVPLNQHTTYDFLSQYAEFAEQMILLLGSYCGEGRLYNCYKHYVEIEGEQSTKSVRGTYVAREEEFRAIPSKLMGKGMVCMSEVAPLSRRPSDLRQLLAMGVDKFKIPSGTKVECHIDALLEYATRGKPAVRPVEYS